MRLRIIVFEDDEPIRILLQAAIARLGHEVLAFSDPLACPLYTQDACTCTQEHPCGDLLITDNQMPRMTGLEFIRRQAERGCKGVAANKAVLSGNWSEVQRREAAELGCRIVRKPFDLGELSDWIKEREAVIASGRQVVPAPVLTSLPGMP